MRLRLAQKRAVRLLKLLRIFAHCIEHGERWRHAVLQRGRDRHHRPVEGEPVDAEASVGAARGIEIVISEIIGIHIGAEDGGRVTDALEFALRLQRDRVVLPADKGILVILRKLRRRGISDSVAVGGDMVARVGEIVHAIPLHEIGSLRPAADGCAVQSGRRSRIDGEHILHARHTDALVARIAEVHLLIVVDEHRAVDAHPKIVRHAREGPLGTGGSEDIVPLAAGRRVHIKGAVVVVHLGRVRRKRHAVLGDVPLFEPRARNGHPVHEIRRLVGAHAHFGVERGDIEIIDAVVAHDERVADPVALPLIVDDRLVAQKVLVVGAVIIGLDNGTGIGVLRPAADVAVGPLRIRVASRCPDEEQCGERNH